MIKNKQFGIFSNPLEGNPLMDKLSFIKTHKVELDPSFVDTHGWRTVEAMINAMARYSRRDKIQWIVLIAPKYKIDMGRWDNHCGRIHNWLKAATKHHGLRIVAIDVGIELRIVAEYSTVSEYMPYWELASEKFHGRKLIAPGFTMISDMEFNEHRQFINQCVSERLLPDIIGVHLYGASYENNLEHKIDMLRKVINISHGLPIAITETGQHSRTTGYWFWKKGGEIYQKTQIESWYKYLERLNYYYKNVEILYILLYTCANDLRFAYNNEGHFGALREKEKGFQPKPVYHWLKEFLK